MSCGCKKKVIAESYTKNKTPGYNRPVPKSKPIPKRWPKT